MKRASKVAPAKANLCTVFKAAGGCGDGAVSCLLLKGHDGKCEFPVTPKETLEAVTMAWTDATNMLDAPGKAEVCRHLQRAAEALDRMIERKDRVG